MIVTLTIPDVQAARLATVLRRRAGLVEDALDPAYLSDQVVIENFFRKLGTEEVRAIRLKVLEEQYLAQKAAAAPDATLADTLLQLQRLRET